LSKGRGRVYDRRVQPAAVELVALPAQPARLPWPTDAWSESEPDPRVDRARLDALFDEAFGSSLGATHGLLIAQRGSIVAERYARDFDAAATHVSWSMAKSVLHAVVGILVRTGRLDPRAPLAAPEWSEPGDPRRAITLDALLRMSSGLRFVEDYVDRGVSHVIEMLFGAGQKDVAAYAAGLPLDHAPDTVWSYSSGTTNLIARETARAVGGGPVEYTAFLARELFEPLGMHSARLRFDQAGTWIGSSFLYATARDFARFGLLYLRDGVWDGQRILPEGWVDYARTPTPGSAGTYGAHWWIVPGSLGIFQAQGYAGQRLTLVPALDLVIVRLGETPLGLADALADFIKRLVDVFRPTR
jgi:CubicO group peptidase (beta-lactamase class C family)